MAFHYVLVSIHLKMTYNLILVFYISLKGWFPLVGRFLVKIPRDFNVALDYINSVVDSR